MIKFKRINPWFLVILWMIIIFYLSHQPVGKSRELSRGIADIAINAIEKLRPEAEFNSKNWNHILRKSAHFFSYLILSILIIKGLELIGIKGYKGIYFAFLISVLFAISDEVHQLFVPGRGGQIKDVVIDSFGAMAGILIYKLNKAIR